MPNVVDNLEVNIKVVPDVGLETAKTCLKIVELFLNNNFGFQLEQKKCSDGQTKLDFVCCCESEVCGDG